MCWALPASKPNPSPWHPGVEESRAWNSVCNAVRFSNEQKGEFQWNYRHTILLLPSWFFLRFTLWRMSSPQQQP